MNSSRISSFFLLVSLLASCGPVPPSVILSLEHGWVRAMPPGTNMTAAYGVLTNHGSENIEITSFGSDSFTGVSLHMTTMEDGVSRMEQLPGLVQAAGTGTVLKPGGLHLMLMEPTKTIHPGDIVGLTLIAASGERYRFFLPVESR